MSAGSVSLESAIRTCKVDTAYANKVESDRFLNPAMMVCPVWNGYDTAGRQVCPDSFVTKRAGCNSATDRVEVENNVSRPQYMEYINLSACGIQGDIYGPMPQEEEQARSKALADVHKYTGQFGTQFGASIYPACGNNTYLKWQNAQQAQNGRKQQAMQNGYAANSRRNCAGV